MKTFDLEAAKRGDPIVTRDGREAKFVAYVPEAIFAHRLVVLVDGYIVRFNETGITYTASVCEMDLFMAPKKRTVWVNLWHSGHYDARDTEAAADDVAYTTFGERVGGKAYPVEIEE